MKFALPDFVSILQLSRIKLSISVAFSTFVACFFASGLINTKLLGVSFGVFLLAAGASTLNQIQEKEFDAQMSRTKKRPIPKGVTPLSSAWILTMFLIIFGLILLYFFGTIISIILGVTSILWYNGVYTLLKRITAFAVLPGTLTGVIPIIIGWQAAGGHWNDIRLIWLASFMALWQLPHFIILMLRYNDDYKNAGFPVLTDIFSLTTVKFFILSGAVFVSGLCFYPILNCRILSHIMVICSILNCLVFIVDLFLIRKSNYLRSFVSINILMLFIMLCFLLDKLIAVNYFAQFSL